MKRRSMIGATLAAGALALGATAPAVAATGDWHEGSARSDRGLEVELSWKDTRRGVSVEGIWVHPATPEIINTYRITGYDQTGAQVYSYTATTAAGDTCLGDPYEEIPNPNVLGSILGTTVTVRVQRTVGGQAQDQVQYTAIRG